MSRYWIADLHLGHAKVAEIRGFDSVRDHDEVILDQVSRLSADGDMLWILGDISSGKPDDEQRALDLLYTYCASPMHLIAGNHDSVSSIHRTGFKKQREWLETFESIQQFGRIKLAGHHVLMSHYPYARSGDGPGRGKARYNEFRLPDVGVPLVHGHTHQSEPHMDRNVNNWHAVGPEPDMSQFCVSWDAHRRLVTEHDLNQWLEAL